MTEVLDIDVDGEAVQEFMTDIAGEPPRELARYAFRLRSIAVLHLQLGEFSPQTLAECLRRLRLVLLEEP